MATGSSVSPQRVHLVYSGAERKIRFAAQADQHTCSDVFQTTKAEWSLGAVQRTVKDHDSEEEEERWRWSIRKSPRRSLNRRLVITDSFCQFISFLLFVIIPINGRVE